MFLNPSRAQNLHPPRSALSGMDPQSIHVQAFELASLIDSIPADDRFTTRPRAIVVGSFALQSEMARDLDIEVQGVDWQRLQEFFSDKVGVAGIADVQLTSGGQDGVIVHGTPGHFGNAFVAVWLGLEGGRKANLSIPLLVHEDTSRYDLNSVTRDPDLPFTDAARRRSFVHRAVGYDPLSGDRGEIIDPLNGAGGLANRALEILDPGSFKNDPLGLYTAVREMVQLDMYPSEQTQGVLEEMAAAALPVGPNAIRLFRMNYERSQLLCCAGAPSVALRHLIELGAAARDLPALFALFKATIDSGNESRWTAALEETDQAWQVALAQTSWSVQDRVVLVTARLGYELEALARASGLDHSWMEIVEPFVPGHGEEKSALLIRLQSAVQSLSDYDARYPDED